MQMDAHQSSNEKSLSVGRNGSRSHSGKAHVQPLSALKSGRLHRCTVDIVHVVSLQYPGYAHLQLKD